MRSPHARRVNRAVAAVMLAVTPWLPSHAAWAAPRKRLRPVSIAEYYQRAQPDEQHLFMAEARVGAYDLPVKGDRYIFVDWSELYFSSSRAGQKLRSILRSFPNFNAAKFQELCTWRKRDFYRVEVYIEGFLQVTPASKQYTVVIPIPEAMARQLMQKL